MNIVFNNPGGQAALVTLLVEIAFCLALILLVRAMFRRVIGPVGCRLLWGVLIVRCLVPVSLPSQHHPVTHLLNAYQLRQDRLLTKIDPTETTVAETRAISVSEGQGNAERRMQNAESGDAETGAATVMERLSDVQPQIIEQAETGARSVSEGRENAERRVQNAEFGDAEIKTGVTALPVATTQPIEQTITHENGGFGETALPVQTAAHKHVNIGGILFGVWATGCVAFLTLAVVRNRRVVRAACRTPEPVPDWVQRLFLECRDRLKLRVWPVLIVTRHVRTPCLVGAIRPRVLVPKQLLDESDPAGVPCGDLSTALRHVFLHELTHLKQGDIWFSWCWTLVMALHWFNPLLWWVGRLVGFDCEAACDYRVLERLEPGRHASYGRSLLEIMRKLNAPVVRSPGFSAIIEGKTNFERRLVMITNYRKCTWKQTLAAGVTLTLLLAASLTTFAQQKPEPIPADKAKMIGYVEDFFLHNYRDVTMRKSLEWGDIATDDKGNVTIRYKFEALIWDKERLILCEDFTFDKEGNFVTSKKVDGFPQEKEKPDTSTKEGLQKLVEKFFSQNYRDITARKTLEWGEPQTLENGNRSIRYKYEATIWDKDVVLKDETFTFKSDGEFVSVEDVKKAKKSNDVQAVDAKNENTVVPGYPKEEYAELEKLADERFDLEMDNEKLNLEINTAKEKILNIDNNSPSGSEKSKAIQDLETLIKEKTGLIQLNLKKMERGETKMMLKQRQIEERLMMWQLAQEKQQATVDLRITPAPQEMDEASPKTQEKLLGLQEMLRDLKQAKIQAERELSEYELVRGELAAKALKEIDNKDISKEEKNKQEREWYEKQGSHYQAMRQRAIELDTEVKTIENELEHLKAVEQLKRDFGPRPQSPRQVTSPR